MLFADSDRAEMIAQHRNWLQSIRKERPLASTPNKIGVYTTSLLCPWDSPGKNTGVGCHFLLQCMKVKSESKVAQSCP